MFKQFRILCVPVVVLVVVFFAASCGSREKANGGATAGPDRVTAIAHLKAAQKLAGENKQYALAHEEFREAIKSDPGLFPAHLGFQESFFAYFDPKIDDQVKERDSMMKIYADYARKRGDSAEFQFLYGRMLDRAGERTEAAKYYRAALKLEYKLYPAHMALADICEEVEKSPLQAKKHRDDGEKFKMIYELAEAVEQNPSDVPANRLYQDVMLAAENDMPQYYSPGGVEEQYKSLVEKHAGAADEAVFRYLYGRLLGQVGSIEEAKIQFDQATKLDPKLSWPYDGLATYNLQSATKAWDALRKSEDPTAGAEKTLGEMEVLVDRAIRLYQKAASLDPKQTESRLKLLKARMLMTKIFSGQMSLFGGEEPLNEERKQQCLQIFVKAHDQIKACQQESLGLVTEDPQNIDAYICLAMFAEEHGAHLLAQEIIGVAKKLFKALPKQEAELKADLGKSVAELGAQIDGSAARLVSGRGEEASTLPSAFVFEEAAKRLKSENADLRKRTVVMLAALCAQIRHDIDAMPQAVRDDYRQRAQDAARLVAQALDDKDVDVCIESVRALGELLLDPFAEKVAAVLADKGADARLRTQAAIALKKMRVKEGIPALIEGLKADDADVRQFSAEALLDIVGRKFGYNYDDTSAERANAIAEWEKWWAENKDTFAVPAG